MEDVNQENKPQKNKRFKHLKEFLISCWDQPSGGEKQVDWFLAENILLIDKYKNKTTTPDDTYYYLLRYYFLISNLFIGVGCKNPLEIIKPPKISFFLKLITKQFKTKYVMTSHYKYSLISASVGMILKYYGNFKKFFRRSYRANNLLIQFIKNTIIKFVRKSNYVFILEGLNSKIFTLINTFHFLSKQTNMKHYITQPKISYSKKIIKKIKCIKRKIQRKNNLNVQSVKVYLQKFNKYNYTS